MPEKMWQETLKKISLSSNNGEIKTRRQMAEELARESGDASEERVQKILKSMDWHDAARRAPSKEKFYKTISRLFFFFGPVCMVCPILDMSVAIGSIGAGFVCLGFFFFILALGESAERAKLLSPDPPQPSSTSAEK